jgi:hypothetical protein
VVRPSVASVAATCKERQRDTKMRERPGRTETSALATAVEAAPEAAPVATLVVAALVVVLSRLSRRWSSAVCPVRWCLAAVGRHCSTSLAAIGRDSSTSLAAIVLIAVGRGSSSLAAVVLAAVVLVAVVLAAVVLVSSAILAAVVLLPAVLASSCSSISEGDVDQVVAGRGAQPGSQRADSRTHPMPRCAMAGSGGWWLAAAFNEPIV